VKPLRLASVLGAGALAFACSVDDVTAPPPDAGDDGGIVVGDSATTTDASIADAVADSAPTDQPLIRLAAFSPDAPPLDVCFAAHGTTTYVGPIVASVATDGGAPGLSFGQVTGYLALGLAPGVYDVRTVAAGAADCTAALMGAGDTTNLATLAAGERYTIAALGETTPASSDHPYSIALLGDDDVAPTGDVAVRFLHASPSLGALDVGSGSLVTTDASVADFVPWFTNVTYGLTGLASAVDGGMVDSDGYLAMAPFSSMTISAHASGGSVDTVTATGLSFGAGSASTLFLIGGKSGVAMNPIELLLCADDAELPSGDLLAPCSVVSP
jgi:hypothetical protein